MVRSSKFKSRFVRYNSTWRQRKRDKIIVPPIPITRDVKKALRLADKVTEAEKDDRKRIAEECTIILRNWAQEWIEICRDRSSQPASLRG